MLSYWTLALLVVSIVAAFAFPILLALTSLRPNPPLAPINSIFQVDLIALPFRSNVSNVVKKANGKRMKKLSAIVSIAFGLASATVLAMIFNWSTTAEASIQATLINISEQTVTLAVMFRVAPSLATFWTSTIILSIMTIVHLSTLGALLVGIYIQGIGLGELWRTLGGILDPITFVWIFVFKLWVGCICLAEQKGESSQQNILKLIGAAFAQRKTEFVASALVACWRLPFAFYKDNDTGLILQLLSALYMRVLILVAMFYKTKQVTIEDDVLKKLLRNAEGFRLFARFLEKSYCPELGIYWKSIEDYKASMFASMRRATKQGRTHLADIDQFKTAAMSLYLGFIDDSSRAQINLSSMARAELDIAYNMLVHPSSNSDQQTLTRTKGLVQRVDTEDDMSPSYWSSLHSTLASKPEQALNTILFHACGPLYTMFDASQIEVFNTMKMGVFNDFVSSADYKKFVTAMSAQQDKHENLNLV